MNGGRVQNEMNPATRRLSSSGGRYDRAGPARPL